MKYQLFTKRLLGSKSLHISGNVLCPRQCPRCEQPPLLAFRRYAHNPADHDPSFSSIVDNPPIPVRTGQKHGPGLIVLSESLNKSAYTNYKLTEHKFSFPSQPSPLARGRSSA